MILKILKFMWKIPDPIVVFNGVIEKALLCVLTVITAKQLISYGLLGHTLPVDINVLGVSFNLPYVGGPAMTFDAWVMWTMLWAVCTAGMLVLTHFLEADRLKQIVVVSLFWGFLWFFIVNCFSQF